MRKIRLAPSILSADFAALGEHVQQAEAAGADYIHVDVMDGTFVPNITIGPVVVEALRRRTTLPLDVHLMIEDPRRYTADFIQAGASVVTVHAEADRHLQRTLAAIREAGSRAGVALNPSTPVAVVEHVLDDLDLLLVMTVNPGFSGQRFLETLLGKVAQARRMLDEHGSAALLEVDGGIKTENVARVVVAGADVLVAGSAVFNASASVAENLAGLRAAAESAAVPGSRSSA